MPPRERSRYLFCDVMVEQADAGQTRWLTDRVPFRYRKFVDNITVVAGDDDTLDTIAGRIYAALPRGCGLWWVLADFQPDPIHDPTLVLAPGRVIHAPSLRVVREYILSRRRALDAEA